MKIVLVTFATLAVLAIGCGEKTPPQDPSSTSSPTDPSAPAPEGDADAGAPAAPTN